jgi:hypothetical protein
MPHGNYNHIRIEFEDGSTATYSQSVSVETIATMTDDQQASYNKALDGASNALYERLKRLGKDGGHTFADLRAFNGNFATGRGRSPGPKAVKIVARWVGPTGSEPVNA